MTPTEQEKLFKQVRNRFDLWNIERASGYVHGVVDGLGEDNPRDDSLQGYDEDRPYDVGYVYGFLDARGSDTIGKWILQLADISVDYRWWEHASQTTPTNSD